MARIPCQEVAWWRAARAPVGGLPSAVVVSWLSGIGGCHARCVALTDVAGGCSAGLWGRGGCRGQALITLGALLPPVIWILRGLAFSAMGMRRVSTPAS